MAQNHETDNSIIQYPTTHVGIAIQSLERLLTDAHYPMTEEVRGRLIGVLADLLTAQRKIAELTELRME